MMKTNCIKKFKNTIQSGYTSINNFVLLIHMYVLFTEDFWNKFWIVKNKKVWHQENKFLENVLRPDITDCAWYIQNVTQSLDAHAQFTFTNDIAGRMTMTVLFFSCKQCSKMWVTLQNALIVLLIVQLLTEWNGN